MKQYLELLRHVRSHGVERADRTGTGTLSIFGWQTRFDLSAGFPLVTTKKIHTRSVIYELLWFLRGETNVKYLRENNVTIWDEWADKETGELGPVYGKQWRHWVKRSRPRKAMDAENSQPTLFDMGEFEAEPVAAISTGERVRSGDWGIDQIAAVIEHIKKNPDSRRLIVNAWNVADIESMALPPCHCLFQFYVANGKLSCQLYQRSADIFLGVPFNIASYALLTMMVAQVTGLKPGEFVHTLGDAHLYLNHLKQADEQLAREPFPLPVMELNRDVKSVFDFKFEDFKLQNYQCHPAIRAPIAV